MIESNTILYIDAIVVLVSFETQIYFNQYKADE